MRALGVLVAVWLSGCAATAMPAMPAEPVPDRELAALIGLLREDWGKITVASVEPRWPAKLVRRGTADTDCSGTVLLSNAPAENVDCDSCDTFLFDRVGSATACTERLSAITLVREVADAGAAAALGERLKRMVVESSREPRVAGYEHGYSIVAWPSPTVNQTARFDLERSGEHIRARFLLYRIDMRH